MVKNRHTLERRLLSWTVMMVLLFFSFNSSAAEKVKVGVAFSKTGNAALVSVTSYEVARLAVKEINNQGGLLGKEVVLLEYDNESTSLGSRAVARKAVNDGVHVVIGALYSSHSLAMADVLQKKKIPMISPISTHPDLTRKGDYIFRVCFTDELQGKVMADFARNNLTIRSAAVLVNTNSRYSLALADLFIKNFRCGNCRVWELDYCGNTVDFTKQLEKIREVRAAAAFVPGHYREAAYIIKQARHMGIEIPFLGGDGWLNKMYTYGGDHIHGNYYASQWHHDIPRKESRAFVNRYRKALKKRWHNEPAMALTYDALMVFAEALKNAGSLEHSHIRDSLGGIQDFQGVTGEITFNRHGDPVGKAAVILKFENHGSVYYDRVKP